MTGSNGVASDTQLYVDGRIFTSGARQWATALVVQGDRILYVGDDATAVRIAGSDTTTTDLAGAVVLPGFVDGHAHIVDTGKAARQVNLWGADNPAEIRQRIVSAAEADSAAPRVFAQGWQHSAIPGIPDRSVLDEMMPDRPLYLQAHDLHSIWVNTAALAELGIDERTEVPAGGQIHRDAEGRLTGVIDEIAMHQLVWRVLESFATEDENDEAVRAALRGYREAGITAATDMALDEAQLLAMRRVHAADQLTARITAHWMVHPTGDRQRDLAQVAHAAQLAAESGDDWLRLVGVKIMVDGTVDGCTAAVRKPYANGALPEPVWSLESLAPVVATADAAGLKIAMHAIGDEAVRIAITAVERAVAANGPKLRRHRIEHLEVVDSEEIARLASLGIVASMQPVHSDPAIQDNWRKMLGDERVERGYPWPEMTEQGARLVFGTDSPTSPFAPLPNMFIASTRRSALNPALPPNLAHYAVPLDQAIRHATADAAWASGSEDRYGSLAAGLYADFVVLDRDIFATGAESLLDARVVTTIVGGRTVYTG